MDTTTSAQAEEARRLALEYFDAGPLRRLSPGSWPHLLPLLALSSPPPSETPDPEAVLTVIRHAPSPEAVDFLQALHAFGSDEGRHALHDAAITLQIDRGNWPGGAEDLAAELWRRALTDAEYEQLRALAEVGLRQRAAATRHRIFFGTGGVAARVTPERTQAFCRALGEVLAAEQMGRTPRIKVVDEDDRVVVCVFHGGRRHRMETLDDDGREGLLSGRPRACDVLAYEEFSGRLQVTSRLPSLATTYRAEFGRAFFDDTGFFATEATHDLTPFRDAVRRGSLPTPGHASRIREVALVDCVWSTPDGFRHQVHGMRGRDCIEALQRAGLNDDDLLQKVTLVFTFREGRRVVRTEVALRPGNQFECPHPGHRDAITEYLERIGVCSPDGTMTDGRRGDPLALLGPKPVSHWRRLLGDRLAEALGGGLLRPTALAAVAFPDDERVARTDLVDEVETSRSTLHVARGPDGVRIIAAPVTQGYELDLSTLVEALRRDLRCEQSARPLPFGKAIDLGPAVIGAATVRPVLLPHPRAVDPATALEPLAALAGSSNNARAVVILPPGTPTTGWPHAVALRGLLAPHRIRADVIRALQLHAQVPVHERSNGEDLVVDHEAPLAWLLGVELDLSANEWKLLKVLAGCAYSRRPVSSDEINRELSPQANSPDTAKQCVNQLHRKVATTFGNQRQTLPGEFARIIESKKSSGYRLTPSVYYEGPPWRPPAPRLVRGALRR